MNWYRTLMILIVVPAFALPAPAGLFDKRAKPDPAQRVPLLIGQVKTERDERKRTGAVEELRQYDPRTFPEIIPVLIDVLQNDVAAGVRLQALHSLSSFRPVSQAVGEALEQALASDKSFRVRLQARTTLVSYHWSGYHAARKNEVQGPVIPGSNMTEVIGPKMTEPPLALEPAPMAVPVTVAPPTSASAPQPIAAPVAGLARPLPMRPTEAPPAPTVVEQGPDLAPPF